MTAGDTSPARRPVRGAHNTGRRQKRQEVTVMRKIKVQKNRNYLGTLLG